MTKQNIIDLLKADVFPYDEANEIKRKHFGDNIFIRAILEFSNHCRCDCAYCGLNCENKNVKRFRMMPDDIVHVAQQAAAANYKTIVLQSGEDAFYTPKILGEIVSEIAKTGMSITLSCGEMSFDDYKHLRQCGAERYLLKHETADEKIYSSLHRTSSLQNRVACLKNLKRLGFETGSGFMIGLPNQTLDTIAEDILLLKSIPCDMAGIGPFIPHPQTKLHDVPHGSTEITKRAVAITRMLMPTIHLPATTSLGVVDSFEKDNIFFCGADVIMRKVTPNEFKSLYEIYPSSLTKTDILKEREELESYIRSLNLIPV